MVYLHPQTLHCPTADANRMRLSIRSRAEKRMVRTMVFIQILHFLSLQFFLLICCLIHQLVNGLSTPTVPCISLSEVAWQKRWDFVESSQPLARYITSCSTFFSDLVPLSLACIITCSHPILHVFVLLSHSVLVSRIAHLTKNHHLVVGS